MIEKLEKKVADNKAAGLDLLQHELVELKLQIDSMKKQHKEELWAVKNSTALFRQWTEAFKEGCMVEWTQLSEKVAAIQSENEFLQSRVNALSELEAEVLEDNQMQGVIVSTDDVEVMKNAMVAHASSLWEGLLFKMEDWLMKPYQDIKAMFRSEVEDEYVLRIKELEAENLKLSNQLLQQALQDIKQDLPVDAGIPLNDFVKVDAVVGSHQIEPEVAVLEDNTSEEFDDQFKLVSVSKPGTEETGDQNVEGESLPH